MELKKLGLKEKQIQVYLAALELGRSSAQQIAKQAKISRPTAYQVINQLKNQDLVSESKQNNKRRFAAQSPDHLLGLLRAQKRELEEKEREFIRIIAELRSRYYSGKKNEIKTFQGEKAIQVLLDDFKTANLKQIYFFASNDKIWPAEKRQKAYAELKRRLGKIKIKELISPPAKSPKLSYLQSKILKDAGEIGQTAIIYHRAIILTDKHQGILIDNQAIIKLIKSFFKALWQKG